MHGLVWSYAKAGAELSPCDKKVLAHVARMVKATREEPTQIVSSLPGSISHPLPCCVSLLNYLQAELVNTTQANLFDHECPDSTMRSVVQ